MARLGWMLMQASARARGTRLPAALLAMLLAACGGGGGIGSTSGSSGGTKSFAQLASTLDGFVSTTMPAPSGSVNGYSFALYDKTGTLFTRAGGQRLDGSPFTTDSIVLLDSASKMPSAAAILTLVDSGKLDLDKPVANYLLLSGVAWPLGKQKITMRMLLSHTSGLPGSSDASNPSCYSKETGTTLKQCVQTIANTALVSQPGAEFNYGTADYQVAGYVATVLANQDWHSFFKAAIGDPLGLTGYSYGDAALVTNPGIGAGGRCAVGDYVKILQMVQNGGVFNGQRVLSTAMVAELKKAQNANLPVAYTPYPASQAANFPGYAFGFWIPTAAVFPGSPGPEFDAPGADGSTGWIDDGLGYGAILLIGQDVQTGLDMVDAIRPLIIQQLK